jgi:hypothetical protein
MAVREVVTLVVFRAAKTRKDNATNQLGVCGDVRQSEMSCPNISYGVRRGLGCGFVLYGANRMIAVMC